MNAFFVIYHKVVEHIGLEPITLVKRMDKFNSRRSEFSPMLYGEKYDQLYFASTRTPKGAGKDKEETNSAITGQRNNDLFLVKQDVEAYQPARKGRHHFRPLRSRYYFL